MNPPVPRRNKPCITFCLLLNFPSPLKPPLGMPIREHLVQLFERRQVYLSQEWQEILVHDQTPENLALV